MKQYFIDKNSDRLLIFFTGWGCDEREFKHLDSNSDVLLLYNYTDLNIDFDFSKYNKIDLLSFSAGVFIGSVIDLGLKIDKKIAVSGNPYLFDNHFGLSDKVQKELYNVEKETADIFARNYLVKTDEEWKKFRHSNRSPESCREEFESLKNIYLNVKQNIKDIYDIAIMGDEDPIFDITAQKEYYGERLHVINNARHNLFFRIKNYEQIMKLDF